MKPFNCSRLLLKLSGESLMGDNEFGIHPPAVTEVAREIREVHDLGVEICIVVGGGNIFRGLRAASDELPRTTADHMGMLATILNSLALQASLETLGAETRVLSAIRLDEICEPYIHRRAARHLERKRICIFAAGTGNPFFTTDTAATLRASELGCGIVFKGTQVDGVYDSDPKSNPNAVRMDAISYEDAFKRNLRVMDGAAIAMARERRLQLVVFSLKPAGNFKRVVEGKGMFTTIQTQQEIDDAASGGLGLRQSREF